MTREDTSSKTVSYKPKTSNLNWFLALIFITASLSTVYFVFKQSEGLGDPSDQFVLKNIPRIYTTLEGVDPEERDVFQGFRTSFLPAEEFMLDERPYIKREVHKRDVKSDLYKTDFNRQYPSSTRVKRMNHHSLIAKIYDQNRPRKRIEDEDKETQSVEEYKTSESAQHYDDDDNIESAVPPETHADRGPLDDVVEQVRGQPELEEGEMGSPAHLYKPSQSYSGIHAFWKGEGDKATIRQTQASIMRQYMDAGADPCHNFYQYACGNWASMNPIPADKAGYDTFEMLRENLDIVLKDLLEFKNNENVTSEYPGPHLDLQETLCGFYKPCEIDNTLNIIHLEKDIVDPYNLNSQELFKVNEKATKVINRLRRYLDDKTRKLIKRAYKIKRNLYYSKVKQKYEPFKRQSKQKKNLKKFNHITNRRILPTNDKNINNVKFGRKLQMYSKNTRKRKVREAAPKTKKPGIKVLESLINPANGHENDATRKARFLFKSCMNYEILEKRGHQPLVDLLNYLGGWPILDHRWNNSKFDWLELMAKLRMYNNDILLSEWVGPDIKNSDEFIIQFDQTSLGLPTREYFLQASNKIYLDAYEAYLVKICVLLGGDPIYVKKKANQLIEFETKLAKITSAPEDRRNVSELYRRMTLAELEELVPEVQWKRYLCLVMNRTVQSEETVVLFALNYVQHLVKLIAETEKSILANYLLWRFVRHRVNNLDDRFQLAKQQFYYILFGRERAPSRWKNCISQVNSNMGMALGSMFVRKYFDERSKNDTLHMTKEIQQAFKELLHTIDWIDEKTKSLAAHKVESMMLRIGYPDFILNKELLDERYKEVKIHPDKYFENILNILQHLTKVEQSRIGQPVNKTLWNTAPAVVNAYYSRNKNQIMFPAGILQPPFYHRHFPRSLNYGGIGVVIGHEITHGFDDKGRLFDNEGNLHRWWSDNAIAAFHKRAQCLINQYGQYVVPEVNIKLDGVNTQGENIADNGGVKQAFRAYAQWLQKHGDEGETMPGMNHTSKQLFFLNFAQVWCGAMRPEAMRNKLKTAVHSPGRFRVIGTLSNSDDFAREFNCPLGSQMNPKQKCTVW